MILNFARRFRDLSGMRSFLVTLGSFILTSLVIGNAFMQKKQFYPAVIFLTKSSPSMAVLYIQAFVFVYLLGKLMRKVFFGQLRAAEMEHLVERSWYAVTETCLAFTVFRDDFSTRFVSMFTILLFLKCFHWLIEDRIDYMERSPVISWLFHIRAVSLLTLLCFLDAVGVVVAYNSTIQKGASVQLVFGFEYMILLMAALAVLLRYVLHTFDSHCETPWENKAMYMLFVDLLVSFLQLGLYMVFLLLMIRVHTFPLFIIRPVYISIRAFKKAVHDVIFSRRAIRYMNSVFSDATAEELAASDNICIICREEMTGIPAPGDTPDPAAPRHPAKKLPCGHIFHVSCLRSWFQRQQTCPTCRLDILQNANTAAPNRAGGAAPAPAPAANAQPAQNMAQAGAQNQPQVFTNPMAFVQWLNQQGIPPQPPAPPQSSSTAAPSTSSASSTTQQQTMPNFGMPFNPMMFGMNMFPGASPWANLTPMPEISAEALSKLSEEELTRMEGHHREAIQARIEALSRVRVFLDAAVTQMNVYMTAVQHTTNMPSHLPTTPGRSQEASPETDVKPKLCDPPAEEAHISKLSTDNSSPNADAEDEKEIVRQRRLQKFNSQNSKSSDNDESSSPSKSESTTNA